MSIKSLDKNEILDAIRRAARDLGKRPSRAAFIAHSGISEHKILNHFPNWNSAVTAAGLRPDTSNVEIDDSVLLEDYGRLVRQLRQIPTRVQYRHHGQFSTGSFDHHFGPWSKMPDKFREFAQGKAEWDDVLALLPLVRATSVKPSANQSPVKTSVATESVSKQVPLPQRYSRLDSSPIYGNAIDFRGLRHEPVNENGVIFLFGIVARELGYFVEAVQAGFPDCEAKRQIDVDKWQRVRIEFEFESRNFRDHGHPTDGCEVIVCWRHNWPECPDTIEVLELREVIKQLAKSDE